MPRIAREQESIDEAVLFLRKWRRLSGQVSQRNTKTKQKINESCAAIGSNKLKLTITNTIKDFKHTLTKLRMQMPNNSNLNLIVQVMRRNSN